MNSRTTLPLGSKSAYCVFVSAGSITICALPALLGSSDAVAFNTVGIVTTAEGALMPVIGIRFPTVTDVVGSAVYTL